MLQIVGTLHCDQHTRRPDRAGEMRDVICPNTLQMNVDEHTYSPVWPIEIPQSFTSRAYSLGWRKAGNHIPSDVCPECAKRLCLA